MPERKMKHLEFIQAVIARMNTNSFLVKGWAATLLSALTAFAAKDSDVRYVLVAYAALPAFWLLDASFVATERRYRALYDSVAAQDEQQIDFLMDVSPFQARHTIPSAAVSHHLLLFYGVSVFCTLLVMFVLAR